MSSWNRAVGFGVLMWLIPFAVAFLVFFLHESQRPLFESIMAVAVTTSAVVLGLAYLKRVDQGLPKEGLALGILWLLICIVIDAPLMLFGGPMKMTVPEYMADIGVAYLIIPAVTIELAAARGWRGSTIDA